MDGGRASTKPPRYIKRKQEKEAAEASARAAKSLKAAQSLSNRESVFGDVLQPSASLASSASSAATPLFASTGAGAGTRQPLSPRVTIPSGPRSPFSPRAKMQRTGASTPKSGMVTQSTVRRDENARAGILQKQEDKVGGGDVEMHETGTGVADEAMGLISGGSGLKEVGRSLVEEG